MITWAIPANGLKNDPIWVNQIMMALLPTLQQAIMSCHYDDATRFVYGDKIDSCNDMINDSEWKISMMHLKTNMTNMMKITEVFLK